MLSLSKPLLDLILEIASLITFTVIELNWKLTLLLLLVPSPERRGFRIASILQASFSPMVQREYTLQLRYVEKPLDLGSLTSSPRARSVPSYQLPPNLVPRLADIAYNFKVICSFDKVLMSVVHFTDL